MPAGSMGSHARGTCRWCAAPWPPPPANETEARKARYRFLEEARRNTGCHRVVTAHHADDQAETVAYRILRGTGLAGLAGIPRTREPGLYRPLLSCWKHELADYARASHLRHRTDPTNRSSDIPRNVVRRQLLPLAERHIAPGARRALHRLARLAEEENRLWRAVAPRLIGDLGVRRAEGRVSFSRDALLGFDPVVRVRLLRALAAEMGAPLDAAGTRLAVEFAGSGASGRSLSLPGGVVLSRSFERLAIVRPEGRVDADSARGKASFVAIPVPGEGEAEGLSGGSRFLVRWSTRAPVGGESACPSSRCVSRFSFAAGGPEIVFESPAAPGSSRSCSGRRGFPGRRAVAVLSWRIRAAASSGCPA